MPKTIKEFQLNQSTGEVSVEYSDDSTSKFNAADMVTAQTDAVTGGISFLAGDIGAVTEVGFSSSNTPDKNVLAFNSAVAAGGVVQFRSGVTIDIDSTLEIPSGTTVIIPPSTEIRAVVSANNGGNTFTMFKNKNCNATRVQINSIINSLISGHWQEWTVSFAAAHGLTGGMLYISGDTSGWFNGFWPISSVVNATTIKVRTSLPSPSGAVFPTPTGTLYGNAADVDVSIVGGGKVNANFFAGGFTASTNTNDHAIVFNNVYKPRTENLLIAEVRKYCICAANVWHPKFINTDGNTNSDGVHVYGPCWSPVIDGITGQFGDDAAIFQTVDGPSFLVYQPPNTGGSIYNGVMRNIRPSQCANSGAAVLYPAGGVSSDLGYRFYGKFVIDGVSIGLPNATNYYTGSPVAIGGGYVPVAGSIEDLEVRDVSVNSGSSVASLNNSAAGAVITINKLKFKGISPSSSGGTFNGLVYVDYFNIGLVTFDGFDIKDNTDTGLLTLGSANAVVNQANFRDGKIDSASGAGGLINSVGGTLKNANIDGVYFGLLGRVFKSGSVTFANAPNINVTNCFWDGNNSYALIALGGTQSAKFNLDNVNASAGALFNLYGTGAVNVRIAKSVPPAAALNLQTNVSWYNPDGSHPISITAVKRATGSIAAHSGDANNMYVCDSSAITGSWKKMVNTVVTV